MSYATFDYYAEAYHGSMPEECFQVAADRATGFMDYVTFLRVAKKADDENVKRCCCAMADLYHQYELTRSETLNLISGETTTDGNDGKDIKSETVGGFSRTFVTNVERITALKQSQKELKEQLFSVASEYLAPLGLMYRGSGVTR